MGSPQGNRFPVSDQMKTTERFTRLNNDMMLYEIKTEDPVVVTRPWTVRYPAAERSQLRVVGIRLPRRQPHDSRLHQHVARRAREASRGRSERVRAVRARVSLALRSPPRWSLWSVTTPAAIPDPVTTDDAASCPA